MDRRSIELKKALGEEYQKLGSTLRCQQAIGGHRVRDRLGISDKELQELISNQEAWIRARHTRLVILEATLEQHPVLKYLVMRRYDRLLALATEPLRNEQQKR